MTVAHITIGGSPFCGWLGCLAGQDKANEAAQAMGVHPVEITCGHKTLEHAQAVAEALTPLFRAGAIAVVAGDCPVDAAYQATLDKAAQASADFLRLCEGQPEGYASALLALQIADGEAVRAWDKYDRTRFKRDFNTYNRKSNKRALALAALQKIEVPR